MVYDRSNVRRRTAPMLLSSLVLCAALLVAGCASHQDTRTVQSLAAEAILQGHKSPDGSDVRAGAVIVLEDAVFSVQRNAAGVVILESFGLAVPFDQIVEKSITGTEPLPPDKDFRYFLELSAVQVKFSLACIDGFLCTVAHSDNMFARDEAKRWYTRIRTKGNLKLTVLYFPASVESGSLVLSAAAKASLDRAFGLN